MGAITSPDRRGVDGLLALALLTTVYVTDVIGRLRGAAPLGPPRAPGPSGVVVERVGQGLACLGEREAGSRRVARFDRRCVSGGAEVPCGRMPAQRRLLLGARLDPSTASVDDLESLPGVGPATARAIVAARGPPGAGADSARAGMRALSGIPGLGQRRLRALAPLLGLDAGAPSDICSDGLWPTISSGSDRQH